MSEEGKKKKGEFQSLRKDCEQANFAQPQSADQRTVPKVERRIAPRLG
jgi:hypothetical protein